MSNDNLEKDTLSLDELEQITGGIERCFKTSSSGTPQLQRMACRYCGEVCMVNLNKSSFTCSACRKPNIIAG